MAEDIDWTIHQTERQWSFNDFWSLKQGNWKVIWLLFGITDVVSSLMDN
jgi:hypothetical protein